MRLVLEFRRSVFDDGGYEAVVNEKAGEMSYKIPQSNCHAESAIIEALDKEETLSDYHVYFSDEDFYFLRRSLSNTSYGAELADEDDSTIEDVLNRTVLQFDDQFNALDLIDLMKKDEAIDLISEAFICQEGLWEEQGLI